MMIEGLRIALRYERYSTVVLGIEPLIRQIQYYCPVHGKGWFERIGETNIFYCENKDHFLNDQLKKVSNPDVRFEKPCGR